MANRSNSDLPINCPSCGYTQTIGELRESRRCGNCGKSTRSGAQLKEMERKAELDDLRARIATLEQEREAWEALAEHQVWCRYCAEDGVANCSTGAELQRATQVSRVLPNNGGTNQ